MKPASSTLTERIAQSSAESSESGKVLASISVDVDVVSCYYRAYGINACDGNQVYDLAMPRLMSLFEEFGIRATFFVVAKDVRNHPQNAQIIRRLAESGHEIANHTLSHPFRLTRLPLEIKANEIAEAEPILSELSGQPVTGFRSPGWDIDADLMSILEDRGYEYDSSVFPSFFLLPLKLQHRLKNWNLETTTGMGSPWFSFAPTRPYHPNGQTPWKRGSRRLLEIPIGVVPDVRIPFLGTVLFGAGWSFFRASLEWVVFRRQPFNFELHPIELLGLAEDGLDARLERQPGMRLSLSRKLVLYRQLLTILKYRCHLVTMCEMAKQFRLQGVR
ncbi:MAG: polysaccharide deacetylase family protein [Acidobacteria bacterium]|nr:polysaccharide deacetylase family protein [Acidobacteriota bacterium]MCI0723634.1 polysaccharide deacetylase family protein [Acidobacteriota bacterium]